MGTTIEQRLYNDFYALIMRMRITQKGSFYKRDREQLEAVLDYYLRFHNSFYGGSFSEEDEEHAVEVMEALKRALSDLNPLEFRKFAKFYFTGAETP